MFWLENKLERKIQLKLTNECWKTFKKIMAKVDTMPSLASSNKRQNVT
jgi:hypothetical protein